MMEQITGTVVAIDNANSGYQEMSDSGIKQDDPFSVRLTVTTEPQKTEPVFLLGRASTRSIPKRLIDFGSIPNEDRVIASVMPASESYPDLENLYIEDGDEIELDTVTVTVPIDSFGPILSREEAQETVLEQNDLTAPVKTFWNRVRGRNVVIDGSRIDGEIVADSFVRQQNDVDFDMAAKNGKAVYDRLRDKYGPSHPEDESRVSDITVTPIRGDITSLNFSVRVDSVDTEHSVTGYVTLDENGDWQIDRPQHNTVDKAMRAHERQAERPPSFFR